MSARTIAQDAVLGQQILSALGALLPRAERPGRRAPSTSGPSTRSSSSARTWGASAGTTVASRSARDAPPGGNQPRGSKSSPRAEAPGGRRDTRRDARVARSPPGSTTPSEGGPHRGSRPRVQSGSNSPPQRGRRGTRTERSPSRRTQEKTRSRRARYTREHSRAGRSRSAGGGARRRSGSRSRQTRSYHNLSRTRRRPSGRRSADHCAHSPDLPRRPSTPRVWTLRRDWSLSPRPGRQGRGSSWWRQRSSSRRGWDQPTRRVMQTRTQTRAHDPPLRQSDAAGAARGNTRTRDWLCECGWVNRRRNVECRSCGHRPRRSEDRTHHEIR